MSHTNDCIHAKLTPADAHIHEKILAWLQANGATSNQLSEAWHEFLDTKLAPAGHLQDRQAWWYKDAGATGDSLGDLENDYWCNIHV